MPSRRTFGFVLDTASGVPVYRQLIDQVLVAISADALRAHDQLPTVRQVAVDLSINPNTVVRAYKELEIRGLLATQQGVGTFITGLQPKHDDEARQRRLIQMISELVARAGGEGYSVADIRDTFEEMFSTPEKKRS